MYYLYAKDRNNMEFCERFSSEEDLSEYCFENIPRVPNQVVASLIEADDESWGFDVDDSSTYDQRERAACMDDAQSRRFLHPFWVVNLGESNYIAYQCKSDVDWIDLYMRWVDQTIYIIPPTIFVPGDSAEAAQKAGMTKLSRFVREDEESAADE